MLEICVFITTYDRPHLLLRLLKQVEGYTNRYNIHLIIAEDKSEADYSPAYDFAYGRFASVNIEQLSEHKGKKEYHAVLNAGLKHLKRLDEKATYFFKLDDDQQLESDFFREAISRYTAIMDHRKIAMTLINHGRTECWTRHRRTRYDSNGYRYYKTQFVDGAFMGTMRFWRAFRYRVSRTPREWWEASERRGSGVYRTISVKLTTHYLTIYCPLDSLVYHGDTHPSKMNPKERKINRIISQYEG